MKEHYSQFFQVIEASEKAREEQGVEAEQLYCMDFETFVRITDISYAEGIKSQIMEQDGWEEDADLIAKMQKMDESIMSAMDMSTYGSLKETA